MVNYRGTLLNAVMFSIEPKRWLPVFLLDTVSLIVVLKYVISNFKEIKEITSSEVHGLAIAARIFELLGFAVIVFIIWRLIRIYVSGAIIYQAANRHEFLRSWKASGRRYISLLGVSVVVGVISLILSGIPKVGGILVAVVDAVFIFAAPAVIVSELCFDRALKTSYRLFRNRMGDIAIIWILMSVISFLVLLISLIPLIVVVFKKLIPEVTRLYPGYISSESIVMSLIFSTPVIGSILVLLLGIAVGEAFRLCAKTQFFLHFGEAGEMEQEEKVD